MSWRIVESTGGAFWLERDTGAQGESIYFADHADAYAAFTALRRQIEKPKPPRTKREPLTALFDPKAVR